MVIFDYNAPFDGRTLDPPPTGGGELVLAYLRYAVAPDARGEIPFTFANGAGSPPMRNLFTSLETRTLVPLLIDGCVLVTEGGELPFLRGDANGDGEVDVADAIHTLAFLFAGGPGPVPGADAGDANDSGDIDVADPISLLAFLFADAPAPPYPFPRPGLDPTEDSLDGRAGPAGRPGGRTLTGQ
jgi:hypothetical protein